MNLSLLSQIVCHIFASFSIIPSNFIDGQRTGSLMVPAYKLPEKIFLEIEDKHVEGQLWGCQAPAPQEIKILLGDCSDSKSFLDLVMIVQSKNAPTYGLYLAWDKEAQQPAEEQMMLAVSLDGKAWMKCSTFLQATFLAAMEQIKELHLPFIRCTDYKSQYQSLMSFLDYYDQSVDS